MDWENNPDAKDAARDPSGSAMQLALFATAVGGTFAAAKAGIEWIGKPLLGIGRKTVTGVSNAAEETATESDIDTDHIY